ncbi:MAG: hypothetical protein LBF59_06390 [Prevotellaceae bacterium]|nr:hypothetical protein [Prevotellaceae bacterium]
MSCSACSLRNIIGYQMMPKASKMSSMRRNILRRPTPDNAVVVVEGVNL